MYSNFSRGLITEASLLAFPDNATIDELNCDIQENGQRVRRYGFDVEAAQGYNVTSDGFTLGDAVSTHVWKSAGDDSSYTLMVIQIGRYIHFYNLSAPKPLYNHKLGSTNSKIDLETYVLSGFSGASNERRCQFASGKGSLFIAHPYMDPLIVDFDPSTTDFSIEQRSIKIRDFKGVDDALAVDEEPTSLTAAHHYNLRNQGWIDPESTGSGTSIVSFTNWAEPRSYSYPTATGPIAEYYTAKSRYPSNAKIWWASKDENGDFDPAALGKLFFGNTRAPRGHFVVEAFNVDRSAVSGVAGITAESKTERPNCVAFYSGRVFWAGYSTLYFSRTLDNTVLAMDCFQEADPTSEDISDLIATDGGAVEIPNSIKIVALKDVGNGIAIFATNGVWYLQSGAQGFTALDYSLTKISDIGCISSRSVVAADNRIYYWSQNGIQAMVESGGAFTSLGGTFSKQSITQDTINTYFNNLTVEQKATAQGVYDPASNKVIWMYENSNAGTTVKSEYYNFLVLDLTLQAFVPWAIQPGTDKVSGLTVTLAFPCGAFVEEKLAVGTEDSSFLNFPTLWIDSSSEYRLGFGHFTDQNYIDFKRLETAYNDTDYSRTYQSYLLTGFEVLGDGMRRKQTPFLYAFFKRTEGDVTGDSIDYTIDDYTSCQLQTRWNWSNISNGKWSSSVQAYRPRAIPFADDLGTPTSDPGVDVVYSRNKVRGSGNAVQFRFYEDAEGKGFTLLGWQVLYQARTTP